MFQNVIFGWLARRALEIGGLVGALYAFYAALPPSTQDAIAQILTGDWQRVTLGALAPIAIALWGYIWSWRSTVRPQVVTTDARQVPLPKDSGSARQADAVAAAAPQPRTIFERLFKR